MKTNENSIRVLLIEDNPGDVRLIREMLQEAKGKRIVLEHCGTLTEGLQALSKNDSNILLLDLNLPDSKGFETFIKVFTHNPEIPIIVLTGTNDEELAIKSVRTGAQDYLVKGRIDSTLLSRSISYAIERAGLLRVVQQELIERKAMESLLRKVNRALHVLSECNGIIVHNEKEKILAEKICHAIITIGEYQFAWIAFANTDEGSSIQPIAIDGSKDGNSPKDASVWFIRSADTPLSEALKTGNVAVCNDITIDKRCSNLRAEAEKLGYRSFVILPLVAGGKILGVVQICSKETDQFDQEELKLLNELKEDIAYAIVSIRTENERKQSQEAVITSEIRYRRLFEAAKDGILILDINTGIITDVNPFLIQMLGYTKEQFLGKAVWELGFLKDIVANKENFLELQQKKYMRYEDLPLETINGQKIHVEFVSNVYSVNHHQVIQCNIRDITERKRTDEKLRLKEERYRELFDNISSGVAVYEVKDNGEDFIFTDFNKAGEKLDGNRREDLIGKSIFEARPGIKKYGLIEVFKRVWKTGTAEYFPPKLYQDTRLNKWYENFVYRLPTSEIVALYNDVTESKRAEEALRESEEKFRRIFEDHSAVKLLIDPDSGEIIDANKAAAAYYGWSCEELKRMKIEQINTLTPEEVKKEMEKVIAQKRNQFEFKHRRKDGSIRDVEVFSSKIVIGNRNVLHSIVYDITTRKKAEVALRESEEIFNQFLINSPVLVYIKDENHRFNKLSKSFEDLFGKPISEMIGKDLYELLPPELAKSVLEDDKKVLKEGIGVHAEEKLNDRVLTSIKFPIHRGSGKPDYLGGFSIDITEHKQMEEGLRQMQKLEGLGTLAGGIAHDFNNILGIILAYNESIKRVKDDSKKLDHATDTITKAVDRGKTLVQQILTFARKTETAFGAVNVNDVVMEIVTMIYEMFPKNITCSQNFDKSIPYINADRSQLHQVLMNLCVNARDAMPKGGVLSINTRMVSVVSLRNQYPDAAASTYVCVEVSDTGEGMTEEIRQRVFEPFFTTKGIGKGTGLGLSVTFGVIQDHKGFIDLESELGKGTTFRLYLPLSEVEKPVIEKHSETFEEIPGGTETLLIVEDEELLLMSLEMMLADKGYNILTAQDGLVALKIYQEKKNDIALVMTDLGLPNITGLEVCQRIKKINPKEHIVLASGYLDPEKKAEFLKAGIQHFLYKPYDITKVVKMVREVLDEK